MSNLSGRKTASTPSFAFELPENKVSRVQAKTILTAALVLILALSAPSARANEPGWVSELTGPIYGKARFTTTARAFRSDSFEAGYSVVGEAPLWKFVVFNSKSKTYFPVHVGEGKNASNGRTTFLRAAMLQNTEESVWQKVGKSKFKGHPMDVWRTTPKDKKSSNLFNVLELWAAADIPITKEVAAFNHCINGFPKELRNLPVRCLKIAGGIAKEATLETVSIKPAMLAPSVFAVPKDYKMASNEMEVVMNTQDLSNILDGMGGDK